MQRYLRPLMKCEGQDSWAHLKPWNFNICTILRDEVCNPHDELPMKLGVEVVATSKALGIPIATQIANHHRSTRKIRMRECRMENVVQNGSCPPCGLGTSLGKREWTWKTSKERQKSIGNLK
jgi:ribosomal protein L37E